MQDFCQNEVTTTQSEVAGTPLKENSETFIYQGIEMKEKQDSEPRSLGVELGLVGTSEVSTTLVGVMGEIAEGLRNREGRVVV